VHLLRDVFRPVGVKLRRKGYDGQQENFLTEQICSRHSENNPGAIAHFGEAQPLRYPALVANLEAHAAPTKATPTRSVRLAALTGFLFAILQSLCSAYLALSGIRVAIGLTALAAAGGTFEAPKGWHQDAIRIPMLILAGVGAVINLAVLFRVRRLRAWESGHWRRRTLSEQERRSERWQLAIALITLALIGTEVITHRIVHLKPPANSQSLARP